MMECALRRPSTPKWPHGYPRFGQRCPWLPNPFSGTCLLMFPKWVLQERWLSDSESEQSGAPVLRLPAWRSTALFLGRWMAKPIWLFDWRRLLGDFGRCKMSVKPFGVRPPGLVARRRGAGLMSTSPSSGTVPVPIPGAN
jgi:hypothetical protein